MACSSSRASRLGSSASQQPRHARAAAAVERLQHDVAVPGAEVVDRLVVRRDQGRRLHAGEISDEQLLGCVAHLGRIVHHQGVGMHLLQEVGGGDVGHVERRILAHQDDVDVVLHVQQHGLAQLGVGAFLGEHLQRLGPGEHPAVLQRQLVGGVEPQFVAAVLGLHHHQEGRVGVDVDPQDGIHLDGDSQRHGGSGNKTAGEAVAV
jgi:hypothetical protein